MIDNIMAQMKTGKSGVGQRDAGMADWIGPLTTKPCHASEGWHLTSFCDVPERKKRSQLSLG
ncbi:hypothetical protein PMI04_015885 [Sphingobium sp. AP49]|uniref:hypothetical protein n=1 Tax=Sphingobium sp. AP49 TaxID=1144307 RepID=UPI0012F706F0|nr:hypothetical protein [Sphingobium sp. AP49]WHO38028.1 hypothetical protein PMI04_015885 [Sphingobium sp. AP49]